MAKFSKEVKQVFGFLGEDQDYSKKQLTLTSWGVYAPKFDKPIVMKYVEC